MRRALEPTAAPASPALPCPLPSRPLHPYHSQLAGWLKVYAAATSGNSGVFLHKEFAQWLPHLQAIYDKLEVTEPSVKSEGVFEGFRLKYAPPFCSAAAPAAPRTRYPAAPPPPSPLSTAAATAPQHRPSAPPPPP